MTSKLLQNVLISPIVLVATVSSAMAGDLFGGPVFSSNQTLVACEITNVTSAPVTITSKSIFNKSAVNLSFLGDTCTATLAAFSSCYYAANVPASSVHTCFLRIVQGNDSVRGTAHARNISNTTVSELQMR